MQARTDEALLADQLAVDVKVSVEALGNDDQSVHSVLAASAGVQASVRRQALVALHYAPIDGLHRRLVLAVGTVLSVRDPRVVVVGTNSKLQHTRRVSQNCEGGSAEGGTFTTHRALLLARTQALDDAFRVGGVTAGGDFDVEL